MVVLHAAPCGQRPALRLRPWCEQDIPELIDIYRDRSTRRQARTAIITHDDAWQWLEIQRKGWRDGDRLSFAVLDWTAGHDVHPVLGNMVLKGHAPGKASAEVGYWTAPGSRGRGVASGALTAITAWSFQNLDPDGLRYIELLHQAGNHASCRVAQKSGYALTGVLPAKPPDFPDDGHLHRRYSPRAGADGSG